MKPMKMMILLAGAALVGMGSLSAALFVEKTDGQKVVGRNITGSPDGTITLVTETGTLTFKKGQYLSAGADRPAALDQARQAVLARQFDAAIPALQSIVRQFPNLMWDVSGGEMLAFALLETNDAKGAIDWIERIQRANDRAFAQSPNLEAYYWKALLADKQLEKLEALIDGAVKGGNREQAARAQLVRGDVRMARGQQKEAVLDYMRTVILFEKQEAVQPEALLKVGMAFEALKDTKRAAQFFKKVIDEYPDSAEAGLAKGKI